LEPKLNQKLDHIKNVDIISILSTIDEIEFDDSLFSNSRLIFIAFAFAFLVFVNRETEKNANLRFTLKISDRLVIE